MWGIPHPQNNQKQNTNLAILCDLFGMVKWPFQGLSDSDLPTGKSKGHFESPGKLYFNLSKWQIPSSNLTPSFVREATVIPGFSSTVLHT